jgi:hypothetical protein
MLGAAEGVASMTRDWVVAEAEKLPIPPPIMANPPIKLRLRFNQGARDFDFDGFMTTSLLTAK